MNAAAVRTIFACTLALCGGLCRSIPVQAATVHYMAMLDQGAPFQIEVAGQPSSGIITDIVDEIFRGSAHRLEIHRLPVSRMHREIASGRYHNWIRYSAPTWGGANSNLSDDPILVAENVLVMARDARMPVTQLEDLFGQQLILVYGFSYPELKPYIDQGRIGVTWVKGYSQSYTALLEGRGIALSDIRVRMRYNLCRLGLERERYAALDFSQVMPDYRIHLNMDPEMDPDVQAFINTRLHELRENGFVDAVIRRYIPDEACRMPDEDGAGL